MQGMIFMTLKWREQLSVGNDLIDSDHQYLIEIINAAEHSLKTNDRAGLTVALTKLSKYSKMHFAREEKLARAIGYSQSSNEHVTHEALIWSLSHFIQEIGEDWTTSSGEHFGAFLRNWMMNHVIKEDMLMKPLLKKYSPRFDPR